MFLCLAITDCTPCPLGKYNNIIGQDEASDCKDCGAGRYTAHEGRDSSCLACDRGRYNDQAVLNAALCFKCGTAKYTRSGVLSDSASSCVECPLGFHSNVEVTPGDCPECPLGFYTKGVAQQECEECPRGFYNDQLARTTADCSQW